MKKYQLTSGELCPLGRGLGGQLSISGKYITVWDLGPQAETAALRQGEKKVFSITEKNISAFQQQFKVEQVEKSDRGWAAVLEAVDSPKPSANNAQEGPDGAEPDREDSGAEHPEAKSSDPDEAAEQGVDPAATAASDDQDRDSTDSEPNSPGPENSEQPEPVAEPEQETEQPDN
jgi:hypothetical protein